MKPQIPDPAEEQRLSMQFFQKDFTISGDDYRDQLASLQSRTRLIWFLNGLMLGLAIGAAVLLGCLLL